MRRVHHAGICLNKHLTRLPRWLIFAVANNEHMNHELL